MKILITGGAGFLGSHLTDRFLSRGHSVTVLDDLSTGSMSNLSHLTSCPEFDFVKHDVRKSFNIKSDLILNFACPASPIHYQSDPVKTLETNVLGMTNVLRCAKEFGSRVVQASTSEVYGDPTISPQTETYWGNVNPIGLRSCYDEGKRAAETLCFDYRRQHSVDVRIVRIFNTYGPRMAVNDGRVVSNLIVQSLQGKSLTIYGDGSQSRSFCYVDDLMDGIEAVSLFEINPESPINLGNPVELSMLELSNEVINATGVSVPIEFKGLPVDDPKQRCPDITLAQTLFDWNPKVNLSEGLFRTMEYFKGIL
jgi:UDP-glucuronate decarboxylase